jgi:hypothetical protein
VIALTASASFAQARPALEAAADEPAVRAFLQSYFKTKGVEDPSTRYAAAFADLNGDGRLDALAYVSGRGWCGSGGCKLYVLENLGGAYRIVARTTITRPPISVLHHRTKGWRDISVWVAGGGVLPGHETVLRFDGRTYPGNPSMQAARRTYRYPAGEVVIARDARSAPL